MSTLSLQVGDNRENWLTQRDPRVRVITAVLVALVVISLTHLPLLALTLTGAVTIALAVGLTPLMLVKRLAALETFMLIMLAILPFSTPGAVLFQLGTLTASHEGLALALSIVLKANTVVLTLLALCGTLEPVILGHTLARLGVSNKLAHLFLFTVRYIAVIHDEYRNLRRAMRARAFVMGSNFHSWRSLGNLFGMLLVRSMGRSQRIMAAMKCRGFECRFHLLSEQYWRGADSLMLFVTLSILSTLITLEFLL